MSEMVVGIDLGTTNSLIAAIHEGELRIFRDAQGQELLPSAVSSDGRGGVLVGRAARNRRVIDPEGTVLSVKRKMGQDTSVNVGTTALSPPQVSALILGTLLDRVEATGLERPRRAVITVPAYFNDAQRQATRDAGALAGLTVERLVNEPTAAAMTYQTGREEVVLVYDLGGGTFDVSILDRDADFLEVRASRGDTALGGDDIDRALLERVLERLGPTRAQVERDLAARMRLLDLVERAKITLSEREEVSLYDPFLGREGGTEVHLDLVLTRVELEAVARPFIERTLTSIEDALADARLTPDKLDRVLLVGGSSKMPLVRALVSERLGRPAQADLDADRAVALGAGRIAGRIAGEDVRDVLVDITPHTLAMGTADSPFAASDGDLLAVPVIARDSVVPIRRTRTAYTMVDGQQLVSFPIVQGEGRRVADNTALGSLTITELPESPAGSPVEVSFQLDISGVLQVSALHVPSGREAAVTIANSPYQLTAQKREAAKQAVETLRRSTRESGASLGESDVDESDFALAEALLSRAGRALERGVADPGLETRLREVRAELEEASKAHSARVPQLIEVLSDILLDLA